MTSGNSRSSPIKWVLLIVVAVGVGVFFLRPPGKPPASDKPTEDAPVTQELAPSDVSVVHRQALARKLPLSGSLTPLVQTTIKSKVSGEVLAINVREGQAVHRGDVLARIDTRNQQALVASQQAGVEKAKADLALARLNNENNQRLLERHFIAQNVLDTSASVYAASAAGLKAAEAQLRLGQIGLQDAVVLAPIDGVVSRRSAEPGEKISPDSPLLNLVDLSKLELRAAAPASEIPAIKPGQIAHVRVDGFAGRSFEGKVERINPTAEQGSRSIMLYLSIDNPDGALKGGMFAQADLVIASTEQVLTIPTAAVRSEAGNSYVVVVEQGKLARKPVTLGLSAEDDAQVEVQSGLGENAQVVVARLDALKPGTPVVIKAPSLSPASAASR